MKGRCFRGRLVYRFRRAQRKGRRGSSECLCVKGRTEWEARGEDKAREQEEQESRGDAMAGDARGRLGKVMRRICRSQRGKGSDKNVGVAGITA